jgi:hypothetical protein
MTLTVLLLSKHQVDAVTAATGHGQQHELAL